MRKKPAAVGRTKGRTVGGMARSGALGRAPGGRAKWNARIEERQEQYRQRGDVGRPEDIDWKAPIRVWRADD